MRTAIRSYLFGMHNPLLHSATVTRAWIQLYGKLPSMREGLCIAVHDIGYLTQTSIDGKDNRHPELGARMCGRLFGQKYFSFCIAHSREYAKKFGLPLSKLGYADKGSVLMYPDRLFSWLIKIGGEAEEYHRTTKTGKWGIPYNVKLIKADYRCWMLKNAVAARKC